MWCRDPPAHTQGQGSFCTPQHQTLLPKSFIGVFTPCELQMAPGHTGQGRGTGWARRGSSGQPP